MKKPILAILFIVFISCVSLAQRTTLPEDLQIPLTELGTKQDSVLVRDTEGVVKYVPQSQLTPIKHTPTLQQVTTEGNSSTNDLVLRKVGENTIQYILFDTDGSDFKLQQETTTDRGYTESNFYIYNGDKEVFRVFGGGDEVRITSDFNIYSENNRAFKIFNSLSNKSATFNLAKISDLTNIDYSLPNKPITFAGLSDIPDAYTKTESDNEFVDKTSNQTITGTKTFDTGTTEPNIVSNVSIDDQIGLSITNTAFTVGMYLKNEANGHNIFSQNDVDGNGMYSINNGIGNNFYSENNSSGTGFFSNNTSTGEGIVSENYGIGTGISTLNTSTGIGIKSENSSSGHGIVSNAQIAATGFNYVGQNQGVNTFTVDKFGNTIGNSFKGDGSQLTNIPLPTGFYEEDQFTPTLIDQGGGATYSFSHVANYIRFGNMVNVTISLSNINQTGTQASTLKLGGLPFTCVSNSTGNISNLYNHNDSFYSIHVNLSGNEVTFLTKKSLSGSMNNGFIADFSSGSMTITLTYITDIYTP